MSSTQALQGNSLSEFAFDIHFNAAVLTMCSRLLPGGYDVSLAAPETYEELIAHLDAGGRMVVYSGGSERTIYGDPEVNFAFRAWHDWCHWRGRHDFSQEGERVACAMQSEHLVTLYGESRGPLPQNRGATEMPIDQQLKELFARTLGHAGKKVIGSSTLNRFSRY